MTDIKEDYFNYLTRLVRHKNRDMLDRSLLRWLFNQEFYGIIPNDDNREYDGKYLRYEFSEKLKINSDLLDLDKSYCSVLEMLIALAQRMSFNASESSLEDESSKWFWIFINNLKLRPALGEIQERHNLEIIHNLINRNYKPNGCGGIFPLEHPTEDQREVEIWYQMMYFIEELGL